MKQRDNVFDVLVAKCGRTIGLKGDIKLIIYTDFLEIFTPNNLFKCGDSFLTLHCFNRHNASARFVEIADIENAKMLNSLLLYTTKDMTRKYCKLDDDEFFWFDIIGLNVYDGEILVGKVCDIERIANTNYLVVGVDSSIYDKYRHIKAKQFLVPYIKRYIVRVDFSQKCVVTIDTIGILEES